MTYGEALRAEATDLSPFSYLRVVDYPHLVWVPGILGQEPDSPPCAAVIFCPGDLLWANFDPGVRTFGYLEFEPDVQIHICTHQDVRPA